MVFQGVSTRKVSAITEELCGASFSKSTVSALCVGLGAKVQAYNERRLEGDYPLVLVDALFIKSREDDRVVNRAALVMSGIRSDGYREILGVKIGGTESFTTWDETFRWLRSCGLKGVVFVVSGDHGGLTPRRLPRTFKARAGSAARYMTEARRRINEFTERFAKSAPKAVACLEAGFDDAMAVMALPEKYRKRTANNKYAGTAERGNTSPGTGNSYLSQ